MQDREVKVLDEEQIRVESDRIYEERGSVVVWKSGLSYCGCQSGGRSIGRSLRGSRFSASPYFIPPFWQMNLSEGLAFSFAAFIVAGALGAWNYQSGKSGREIRTEAELLQSDRSDTRRTSESDHTGGAGKNTALFGCLIVRGFHSCAEREGKSNGEKWKDDGKKICRLL